MSVNISGVTGKERTAYRRPPEDGERCGKETCSLEQWIYVRRNVGVNFGLPLGHFTWLEGENPCEFVSGGMEIKDARLYAHTTNRPSYTTSTSQIDG